MSIIIAIDTSSMVSSVAIAQPGRLAAELTMQARLTHSETLIPHMEEAMKMAGVERKQLEAVAISIGPGSFTGLRIGLAAAKAMAYALDIPIIGVPTMAAMAAHFPVEGAHTTVLIDAQKGNAYRESYVWQDGQPVVTATVKVLTAEEICQEWQQDETPVILTGDYVQKKLARLGELPPWVTLAPDQMMMPRAANVAALGLQRLAAGQIDNIMNLEPLYLRRSEAEVLWEKHHPELAL